MDHFVLSKDFAKDSDSFMLKVRGDSMINTGIHDGDLVIVTPNLNVTNGKIVVALIENEATIKKRYYKETNYVSLQPENELYKPIVGKDVKIVDKVTGLIRMIH